MVKGLVVFLGWFGMERCWSCFRIVVSSVVHLVVHTEVIGDVLSCETGWRWYIDVLWIYWLNMTCGLWCGGVIWTLFWLLGKWPVMGGENIVFIQRETGEDEIDALLKWGNLIGFGF